MVAIIVGVLVFVVIILVGVTCLSNAFDLSTILLVGLVFACAFAAIAECGVSLYLIDSSHASWVQERVELYPGFSDKIAYSSEDVVCVMEEDGKVHEVGTDSVEFVTDAEADNEYAVIYKYAGKLCFSGLKFIEIHLEKTDKE